MKGYRVFTQDMMGYESDEAIYTTNYQLAVKVFNKQLKKVMRENDIIIDKSDFGDIKSDFKKWSFFKDNKESQVDIVCMKAPYIIHKRGKRLTASVYFDYRCSYEYEERDTGEELVVIEEIEIIN